MFNYDMDIINMLNKDTVYLHSKDIGYYKHTFLSFEICLKNQLNMFKIKEVMVWGPNLNAKLRLYLMQSASGRWRGVRLNASGL